LGSELDVNRLYRNPKQRFYDPKDGLKSDYEIFRLKDGMHTACAFLNAEGGWLIFGITPQSRKVVGQVVTDNTQREIAQALSGIEPAVNIRVEYIDVPEHPGNKVIAMHFEAWKKGNQPYTYNGCPYYKLESTTKVMPRAVYDERVRAYQPEPYAWEMRVDDQLSVNDLNENHIQRLHPPGY
jgi:ATP-dependent DNA helicase RecG